MEQPNDKTDAPVDAVVARPGEPSTITTKSHSRKVTENEVVRSDRIELVQAANRFVESIVNKTTLPKIGSGYAPEIELSEEESRTYVSALSFLQRQFDQGYSDAEPIPKRAELEDTLERQLLPERSA